MSIEDFGTNFVYGVRASYHITEDFPVEAAYGGTEANEKLTTKPSVVGPNDLPTASGVLITLQHFTWLQPVSRRSLHREAGMPSIRRSMSLPVSAIPSSPMTATLRSMAGAGYRFLLTDWMALHVDVRDYIFKSDLFGNDKTTNNMEFTGGLTFFF